MIDELIIVSPDGELKPLSDNFNKEVNAEDKGEYKINPKEVYTVRYRKIKTLLFGKDLMLFMSMNRRDKNKFIKDIPSRLKKKNDRNV